MTACMMIGHISTLISILPLLTLFISLFLLILLIFSLPSFLLSFLLTFLLNHAMSLDYLYEDPLTGQMHTGPTTSPENSFSYQYTVEGISHHTYCLFCDSRNLFSLHFSSTD